MTPSETGGHEVRRVLDEGLHHQGLGAKGLWRRGADPCEHLEEELNGHGRRGELLVDEAQRAPATLRVLLRGRAEA